MKKPRSSPRKSRNQRSNKISNADSKIRNGAVQYLGITTVLIAASGCATFFIAPERSKDVWLIVGPVILAGFAALGFSRRTIK